MVRCADAGQAGANDHYVEDLGVHFGEVGGHGSARARSDALRLYKVN